MRRKVKGTLYADLKLRIEELEADKESSEFTIDALRGRIELLVEREVELLRRLKGTQRINQDLLSGAIMATEKKQ